LVVCIIGTNVEPREGAGNCFSGLSEVFRPSVLCSVAIVTEWGPAVGSLLPGNRAYAKARACFGQLYLG